MSQGAAAERMSIGSGPHPSPMPHTPQRPRGATRRRARQSPTVPPPPSLSFASRSTSPCLDDTRLPRYTKDTQGGRANCGASPTMRRSAAAVSSGGYARGETAGRSNLISAPRQGHCYQKNGGGDNRVSTSHRQPYRLPFDSSRWGSVTEAPPAEGSVLCASPTYRTRRGGGVGADKGKGTHKTRLRRTPPSG